MNLAWHPALSGPSATIHLQGGRRGDHDPQSQGSNRVSGGEPGRAPVSERDVKNLHALLSRDLVQEGEPGRLRTRLVNITNIAYSPLAVPQQIDEQFKLLVQKANGIASPFEQSIFLLVGLSYLQPFIDVNKRTARLAANIPLFKAGLCPLSYRHMDNARYMGGLLLFYETLNADGITAAFVDGYEKSSSVLKSHYEEHRRKPDRVDLAYRRGTSQVIRGGAVPAHGTPNA